MRDLRDTPNQDGPVERTRNYGGNGRVYSAEVLGYYPQGDDCPTGRCDQECRCKSRKR